MQYPSKTVLEDLATRRGPATDESFTPFNGREELVSSQFSGPQKYRYNAQEFFDYLSYEDLDPFRVNIKITENGMETNKRDRSISTLEDFFTEDGFEREDIITKWFVESCCSYKLRSSSPYNYYMKTYSATANYSNDEDSSFDLREVETQEKLYDVDDSTYEEARLRLPFYIKALWGYCLKYDVNIFTFIKAYQGIRKKTLVVKPKDFAKYNLVKFKKARSFKGEYDRLFDHERDIKDIRYTAVIDLFRFPKADPEFTELVAKFINICDILEIDFSLQDAEKIDKKFVENLVCLYVPETSEYDKYYGEVDSQVIEALDESKFGKPKKELYQPTLRQLDAQEEETFYMEFRERMHSIRQFLEYDAGRDLERIFLGTEITAKETIQSYLNLMNIPASVEDLNLDFSDIFVRIKQQVTKEDGTVEYQLANLTFESALFDSPFPEYKTCYITPLGAVVLYTGNAENLWVLNPYNAHELLRGKIYGDNTKYNWQHL